MEQGQTSLSVGEVAMMMQQAKGGIEDGLAMLQQALTAMANQGAQVAVHDPSGGPLG